MATQEQRLIALVRRVRERQAAGQALLDETTAVLDLLQNPRLQLTPQQKGAALALYQELRLAVEQAPELPEDLVTWEPDPSEYEEESTL